MNALCPKRGGTRFEKMQLEGPETFVKGMGEAMKKGKFEPDTIYTKYGGFMIPTFCLESTKKLKSFNVRPDDIYVCSYPKSGTTWLQQVVYLILHGSGSARTETKVMEERFPYLEYVVPGVQVINNLPSPRMIKTHLPMSLLPPEITSKKPKILYIARNPKDLIVSYQYFRRMLKFSNYNGTLEDMYELFMTDKSGYAPWNEHLKEYWEKREEDNVLFLTYEQMSKDLASCVRRVAGFLGKSLLAEEVQAISRECSFAAMKENDMANYSWLDKAGIRKPGEAEFMRKGKVGDWKNHLTPEMSEAIDQMLAEKILPFGINLVCDLDKGQ